MTIRFTDIEVTDGHKRWTVTGVVSIGMITLTRIEGDITDTKGLRRAMVNHMQCRPRYLRYISMEET